jgi:hypothetical protein
MNHEKAKQFAQPQLGQLGLVQVYHAISLVILHSVEPVISKIPLSLSDVLRNSCACLYSCL